MTLRQPTGCASWPAANKLSAQKLHVPGHRRANALLDVMRRLISQHTLRLTDVRL